MKVKTREFFMAIFAIVIILVIAAIGSVVFGVDVPILRDIAAAMGL